MMERQPFADLVSCLSHDQPPRVWSLLVTVFGELAQVDGARISGGLLQHLCALIGLKPEAVRVALHRLRKDGWVESERHGRTSEYLLTDWGRAQSAGASPRIYATGPLADRAWLAVYEPGHALPSARPEMAVLSANLLLTSRTVTDTGAFITPVTKAMPLPDWMARKLCDEGTEALAQRLDGALAHMQTRAEALAALNPCERAALRVLIVHDWRRIVLKTPILPDFAFPKDWPGPRCRERVKEILTHLPKQDIETLETALRNGQTSA